MTKDNNPNRDSQTKKSDSTKDETRAAEVKPLEQKRFLVLSMVENIRLFYTVPIRILNLINQNQRKSH